MPAELTFFDGGFVDIEFDTTAILICSDGRDWWFDEWVKYDCDCGYCDGVEWELLRGDEQ